MISTENREPSSCIVLQYLWSVGGQKALHFCVVPTFIDVRGSISIIIRRHPIMSLSPQTYFHLKGDDTHL